MTSLYGIVGDKLRPATRKPLNKESLIEDWVAEDPSLLGLDALIIGRQVPTDHGKFIDLLAMDTTGALIIIELKKDRTPREIVAQVLDYASWVRTLTTPEIYERAEKFLSKRLVTAYREHFGEAIPDQLNASHSMLIVASELDPASRRIVEYLSEEHGVAINTVFFNVFEANGQEWLTTDFLLDQEEVEERSERKVRPPWSGYFFANAELNEKRSWDDYRKYGFIAAGGGEFYSKRLDQLSVGDEVFVFDKGNGYIGYGVVSTDKLQPLISRRRTARSLSSHYWARTSDITPTILSLPNMSWASIGRRRSIETTGNGSRARSPTRTSSANFAIRPPWIS